MDKKGILEPAALISEPGEAYSLDFRKWQGCPTIARTAGGRLWAGWYSGGICEPDENNYNLLVYSDDEGSTWSDPVLVIDSRPEIRLRAMDIQLWMDPAEKLWVFWTQTEDSEQKDENGRCLEYTDGIFGVWAITTQEPESSRPVWTPPVRISDGFLRCRPTVLSDQRILMCPYDWTHDRYAYDISCDHGASWERFFGAVKLYETNCFDEAMAVERRDGILWMLVRTAHGALAQTFSCDKGQSWLPAGLSGIENPSPDFGSEDYNPDGCTAKEPISARSFWPDLRRKIYLQGQWFPTAPTVKDVSAAAGVGSVLSAKRRKAMSPRKNFLQKAARCWQLYILLLPAVIYLLVFNYAPMVGIQIAFRDYKFSKGFWGSAWVGLKHFRYFFNSVQFKMLMENTVKISVYSLLAGFPFPILLALLYVVRMGSTTIWERWNSVGEDGKLQDRHMNSLNHYAYGSVMEWLYRYGAGISPTYAGAGFREFDLNPTPDRRLGFLNAA